MAKRKPQEPFWTPKRLIELRVKARKLTEAQLAVHFERTIEDIAQAIRFEANKRKLFKETKRELINGKLVKVTHYAPEYAYKGAKEIQLIGAHAQIF